MKKNKQVFFVSTEGNDQWSGKLPSPNRTRTDGPFGSIVRARDEIRKLKWGGLLTQPVTVRIRGGTYFIPETISFGPPDTGTRECRITYEAYPGEKPVLSGGRRISGWRRYQGQIQCAHLPEVKSGKWNFRSLFADGERQTRARYPKVDPRDPHRSGFLYVSRGEVDDDRLCVIDIFHVGDWLEYGMDIPADGDYSFWILYSGDSGSFGVKDMAGRCSVRVDGGPATPLRQLPGAGAFRWSRCATLPLKRGCHKLVWRNDQGGMINLKTFALCDGPAWTPAEGKPLDPPTGKHLSLIRATDFRDSHAVELRILPLAGEVYGATSFPYRPGDVKRSWANDPGAEIHIHQSPACRSYMEIVRLEKVDEASHRVTISGPECVTELATGDRFFVENIFEELTAPGEWYLDRRKGVLYHWPKKKGAEVIAPALGRMFSFGAIQGITLSGLTFQETDYSPDDGCGGWGTGKDATVRFHEAVDCKVVNCRFLNIGKYAVSLDCGRDNSVIGNDIEQGAEGGIMLINSAGNQVVDNHIHHCGQVYKHIGGVVLGGPGSNRNVVAHNSIHDTTRWGIAIGGGAGARNRIEFNEIWNACLETYDTGGINVSQHDREFRTNSVIRYNLVHDTVGYSSSMGMDMFNSWAIYLDSFAGGYTVSHNITYRNTSGGVMLQGGRHNHVFNNIFVDGHDQVTIVNFSGNSRRLVFEKNIVYYAGKADLFFLGDVSKRVLRADRNLYFHAGCPEEMNITWFGKWRQGDWSEPDFASWRKAGFDRNSIVADPKFVNPKKDDFRLKSASPALRLGFESIDISKIGLLRKRCRCSRRPALPTFGPCPFRCSGCGERRLRAAPCRHLKQRHGAPG